MWWWHVYILVHIYMAKNKWLFYPISMVVSVTVYLFPQQLSGKVSLLWHLKSVFPSTLFFAVQAGAAGERGVIENHSHREEVVEVVGGLFFSLVVETLSLWTQNSLGSFEWSIINQWYPHSVAINNLLQQLSVCLWKFNGQMLLQKLEFEGLNLETNK